MAKKLIAKNQIALRRFYLNTYPSKKISNLLGIDRKGFVEYINFQCIEGMTIDNFGKSWGFDHIVPTELFDLDNPEDLKLCWYYKNIMPMFIHDNRKKGASVHFSIEKLNHIASDEYTEELLNICKNEIKNTWEKYL